MLTELLPPLPDISQMNQDLFLAVLHPHGPDSAASDMPWGGVDRLTIIGQQVINMALSIHAFRKEPRLPAGQIEHLIETGIHTPQIEHWLQQYDLLRKMYFSSDQELVKSQELTRFFATYVGAVWYIYDSVPGGVPKAQQWVVHLLSGEPYVKDEDTMDTDTNGVHSSTSQSGGGGAGLPPQYTPPQDPPAGSPPVTLAFFNERASQKGKIPVWDTSSSGSSHIPVWTARCMVDGQECGTGRDAILKKAKIAAIQIAFQTLGLGASS